MSRAAVLRLAASRGILVETGGAPRRFGSFEVLLSAPDGQRLAGTDVHELVCAAWDDEGPREVWARALEELREGLAPEPCTDPECEWCGRGPGENDV